MPKKLYFEEHIKFISDNVKGRTIDELVEVFNKEFDAAITKSQIKTLKQRHELKSGIGTSHKCKSIFADGIVEFIKNNHKGTGHKEMAEMIYSQFKILYSQEQIKSFYARYKLNSGLTGRYEKGHVPANKGKPGKTIGRMAKTQFKKGHIPLNHKEIGSERINVDGYIEIKTAEPNKWKAKHVVVHEQYHGKVPENHCVIFGDGDKLNLNIENLLLVSRRQLLILNRRELIHNDLELTKSGIIITGIIMKCADLKKGKEVVKWKQKIIKKQLKN